MLLPKISTILIGVILLLPFAVTVLKMILKDGPDPSTQAEFERMSKEMRIEPDQIANRSVAVYECVTIHPSLTMVWQLSPRRWAGAVGLILVVCLLAIFAFSATNFTPAFSDCYSNVPNQTSTETDSAIPTDRLSQLLAQIDNIDDIDRSVEGRQLLAEEVQMNWLPRLNQILEPVIDL